MKGRGKSFKTIRKWMRQYVLDELYQASEFKREDLIKVEEGKITKIHDVIGLGLKEYIKATAKAVVGLNITEMGLNEFKSEFIKTDEDIKTTLLYGYLTQKRVPFDEDEYILGKEKEGGFKMVDLNLEKVKQSEVVDTSDEFDEKIEEMEEDEKEKIRFSEKTKDVRAFISGSAGPSYEQPIKKRIGYMVRRTVRGRWPRTGVDRARILGTAKTRGGTSKDLYIKFPSKKDLDRVMAGITPQARENLMARLEQVGDAYQIKMVNAADIFAEYEALEEQLSEAKEDYKKDPTMANQLRVEASLNLIREWKANIIKVIISKKTDLTRADFKAQSKHKYGKDILWHKTKKESYKYRGVKKGKRKYKKRVKKV